MNGIVSNLKLYEKLKENPKIVTITCTGNCGKEFMSQAAEFREKEVKDERGVWLKLFWYECPFCGHKYRIQIDNAETLRLKAEYQEAISRVNSHKEKLRNPPDYQIERVLRLRKKLTEKYNKLNAKYDSSFTTLATLNK